MAFQRLCQQRCLYNRLSSMLSKEYRYAWHKNGMERFGMGNTKLNCRYKTTSPTKRLVSFDEAKRYIVDVFKAIETPVDHAEQMADFMVGADMRGHFSHGMNHLEMFIGNVSSKAVDCCAKPQILKENSCTAWVTGCNGLGVVVGNFCMDLAIKKAKESGVGCVCCKESNHYGLAAWFPKRAINAGLIGISMTNTPPVMAPTGSKAAVLGSNTISVGASAKEDIFLLDMATSVVSLGKVEIKRRKKHSLPKGWALDKDGNATTDADKASILLPLGGTAELSSYKGYGLSAAIDVLTGVLAGGNYLTLIPNLSKTDSSTFNIAHIFITIDPNCFAPCFEERLLDFLSRLRCSAPIDPKKAVMVPGDFESAHMKAAKKAGGIEYLPDQLKTCDTVAKRYNVKPLTFI